MASLVHAVERLKNDSLSFLETGRISTDGDSTLLFFLGSQERQRFEFDEPIQLEADIFFNRHGLTEGGELIIPYSRKRTYLILVEKPWGRVRLQRVTDQ
jgi:hypothetical protein